MLPALRIAIEDAHRPVLHDLYSVPLWQTFYASASGTRVPCYSEFMRLMQCLEARRTSPSVSCGVQYEDLKECFERWGL